MDSGHKMIPSEWISSETIAIVAFKNTQKQKQKVILYASHAARFKFALI